MARRQSPPASTSGLRKPFWLIDGRVREADFFLTKLRSSEDLDEARYMFSAFVTAAVAVRDATRTTLARLPGASQWWSSKRRWLEEHQLFSYFERIRNDIQHQGLNPLQSRVRSHSRSEFLLAHASPAGDNAVSASEQLMSILVAVAKEAYSRFWSCLDMPSSYSLADLAEHGGSLEQIEAELGLPAGWSAGPGISNAKRLERLKVYSQTAMVSLVSKYPPSASV